MVRMIIQPSRQLAAVLIAAHAAAGATLVPIDLPLWGKSVIALAVLASLAHALWRHAWLGSAASITAIELLDGDRAAFETRAGTRSDARVLGTTYVTPRLCVLNLRPAGRRRARHALIVGDNVDPESFRRLRVNLKWGLESGD